MKYHSCYLLAVSQVIFPVRRPYCLLCWNYWSCCWGVNCRCVYVSKSLIFPVLAYSNSFSQFRWVNKTKGLIFYYKKASCFNDFNLITATKWFLKIKGKVLSICTKGWKIGWKEGAIFSALNICSWGTKYKRTSSWGFKREKDKKRK